jgi:hypothetical protein
MRKLNTSLLAGLAVTSLLYAGSGVSADDDHDEFKARLRGFNEVPAVSSTGEGKFTAQIRGEDTVDWELSYKRLEGTPTTAAHIHLGQKDVNGGVSVFLCGGTTTPACTPTSGTFRGSFSAADVLGPEAQGIAPGEIAELIRAIRAGKTYVNVHTGKHPGGEIRGQLRGDHDDCDDD